MTRDAAVHELLSGALDGSDVVLEEVTVTPAGRRRVVKVVVDRALDATGDVTEQVESLSLDEIADATRTVSDLLDESDVLGEQPYTLEVTSPGVSRPLTAPRHFQRNVGRLVTLTLRDAAPVTGRITRAGSEDLTVAIPAVKKVPARDETLSYAVIDRAEVQVEFSRKDDSDITAPDDADASVDKEN
ncbi:ribosome maturation protein RimP [Knoellia sinensis KCTC 19936]|uniref:Ribosome maturation factor RimP n=1 Tax=Knoellia sinensis KCTC 19936 TaxID=1385520 RepID=A0A0A0J8J7_9MICO|nr:ribosome maturation factor RimP [Knoellia sinensis]KGN31946.1 ribosome maturation protein RimP [Knoellia sinensis KCTC 19936]